MSTSRVAKCSSGEERLLDGLQAREGDLLDGQRSQAGHLPGDLDLQAESTFTLELAVATLLQL